MTNVLTPQQLAEQGKQVYQSGDYEAAAQLFVRAAEGFSLGQATLDAAEMKQTTPASPGCKPAMLRKPWML